MNTSCEDDDRVYIKRHLSSCILITYTVLLQYIYIYICVCVCVCMCVCKHICVARMCGGEYIYKSKSDGWLHSCMLSGVSSDVVRRLQCMTYTVRPLLYVFYCTSFIVSRILYIVYCTSYIVRPLLYDVQCISYILRPLLYVLYCMSYIVRPYRMSYIVRRILYVV